MTHTPLGFYLLLGATFSWVGFLTCVGLRRRAWSQAIAEADRGHMAAVASLLAELVDQAGELGLPGEIEQDAREFQDLVADVLDGGAALSVQEARDLSNFLHDLTLALPYLPAEGAGEGSTGLSAADRFAEQVGLTVMASSLAADLDAALHDGRYALALASHEPSFSPGAPVSYFDFDGPAHMGL